jgi:branched-chain amino acid transport system permease protein
MKIINFAHGEFLMIAMYIAFWAFKLLGLEPLFSFPLVALLLSLIGVFTYKFVMAPLVLRAPPMSQLVCTLTLSIIIQNIALICWTADYRSVLVYHGSLQIAGINITILHLTSFVIAMIILLTLHLLMKRTYIGLALSATAQNREAAMLIGIKIDTMYALAFMIGVGLAGVGGALLMQFYSVFPTVGPNLCLLTYVISVLGGLGSFFGVVASSFIIGVVEAVTGLLLSPEYARAICLMIFIMVLYFRPMGIFKK